MMRFSPIVALVGAAACILSVNAYGFDNGGIGYHGPWGPHSIAHPIVHIEPDGTVLRAYNGKQGRPRLSIQHPGAATKTIDLPWDLGDVHSISDGVRNKIVIIGEGSDEVVPGVSIMDRTSDRLVDNFIAYSPTLSPDGRYIAYIKVYPPVSVSGVRDIVMIYDLDKSASANRSSGVSTGDIWAAGAAVYPPGCTATSDNVGLPSYQRSRVASRFLWAADASKFVFSDTRNLPPKPPAQPQNSTPPARTKVSLVLVTFGPPSWLPAARVVTTSVCLDGIGTCNTDLRKVRFGTGGIVAFMQTMGVTNVGKPIHIEYSQFHASSALGD